MIDIFYLKLLLSFVIGAFAVVSATVIAEKSGSKFGALIIGFPINLLLGLFFIAWSQNIHAAIEATSIVPMIVGLNTIFLATFAYFSRFNLRSSLFFSLLILFIPSFILVINKFHDFNVGFISWIFLSVISYLFFEKILKIKSVTGKKTQYTTSVIVFRSLLSGSLIALAVYLGKVAGPIFGGLFATFPAAFTSTLVITYLSQGWKFSSAIAKSLILTQVSIVMYSVAVRFFYQPFGLLLGTLLSIMVSLTTSYLIHQFLLKRLS